MLSFFFLMFVKYVFFLPQTAPAIWTWYSEEILLLPYNVTFLIIDFLADLYSVTIPISDNISPCPQK